MSDQQRAHDDQIIELIELLHKLRLSDVEGMVKGLAGWCRWHAHDFEG